MERYFKKYKIIIDKNFISKNHIIYINNKDKFEHEIYLQPDEICFNFIESITSYLKGRNFFEYCVQIIDNVSQGHTWTVEGNNQKQWKDKIEYEERQRNYIYDNIKKDMWMFKN